MSEQKMDGSVAGVGDRNAITPTSEQARELNAQDISTETVKPRKRSGGKAKVESVAGDEPPKPKRSRNSKPKNVIAATQPSLDIQPAEGQGQGVAPSLQVDDLPPLPPVPVPTPEGIAFMQQHTAYQAALDVRWELRRARLESAMRSSKGELFSAEAEMGKPESPAISATASETRQFDYAAQGSKTPAGVASNGKSKKTPKENSIEAGLDIRKEPVSEVDLQAVHDAEDARLLRQLLERSRSLKEGPSTNLGGQPAAAVAQSDVEALHMIRDAATRKLGLAVAEGNRLKDPDYRVAFDRVATELKTEAQAANVGERNPGHSAGAASKNADGDLTKSTAIPESVRKRFLKVDSDYYFPDRSPAFVDRGARLATRGEHPEVVKALIEIAKERDWSSITVKGSEAFRRAAWVEAVRNGLQVTGYKPTEVELAQVNQREPKNGIERSTLREQEQSRVEPQQKQADQALNDKLSAFANERPTLVVKKYPELVQAYALLDAARKFAEVHMPGHESRFVALGKEVIAQQLRDGKEVVGPRVHPDQIGQSRSGRNKSDAAAEKAAQFEVLERDR
ncbi:LPD7 domain-containing protein [Herbaspirillum sp. SJZ107]|uniref:LPD7 domain-containing protein n=1 Tax=Herbaspirillum sp. SJZ107 TaxID=2572881 RepID=UPI001154581C|nr:LPD7 domain-containing protein [Herbaspirillum sp. SJZ107]TQK03417.1 hypothetical protein FBX97_4983 [Herbaspirillum sp. SJZ107]